MYTKRAFWGAPAGLRVAFDSLTDSLTSHYLGNPEQGLFVIELSHAHPEQRQLFRLALYPSRPNERRPLFHPNPQGLMQFSLEPGGHVVELRWGSTEARTWGTWLSALALLLLLATPLSGRALSRLKRLRPRRAPN